MTLARNLWLAVGTVAYVAFAAVQAGGGVYTWLALLALPVLLVEIWRRAGRPRETQERRESAAVAAMRACAWGTILWLAARSGPAGQATFDAAANLGAGASAVAALIALARIPGSGGLLGVPRAARSLDAAVFASVLWGIAVAVPATRALLGSGSVRYDVLASDYATTTAGIATELLFVVAAWRLGYVRRLELGVGDRAAGALALSLTTAVVAVPAAFFGDLAPDRLLPAAVIVTALLCTWAATTKEPTTVSGAMRGILAVAILGAPLTLFSGYLALKLPNHGGTIVLTACALAIGVGLVARAVARPLGPEQSRWLDAIESASRGALQPEPDAAIRAALVALGGTSSVAGNKPTLWRSNPEEVLSVDRAGYLHVASAKAPPRIYELALEEPERTLRVDALRLLTVRRPEVRPLVEWFDAHEAYCATIVLDDDGPLGFILLPRGKRTTPMTLEEARAIRLLADRMSALFAVSSALARSRRRELEAVRKADEMDDERARLEHIIVHDAGRQQAAAVALAERVRSAAYSPAMQIAIGDLERTGRLGVPATLAVPQGVDPVGFAAILHLKSPRSVGPFVVTDATVGTEAALSLWQDPDRSPLALADGGTLVIRDVSALPRQVQEHIAQALSRQASAPRRSSILPPGLVVTTARNADGGVMGRELVAELERWVGDTVIPLPALSERPEDMQALTLLHLTRIGMRLRGEPMGIDPGALRVLMEHTWPGNELELEGVLERAAAGASSIRVTAAELAKAGLSALATTHAFTPDPPPATTFDDDSVPPSARVVRRRRATRRRR